MGRIETRFRLILFVVALAVSPSVWAAESCANAVRSLEALVRGVDAGIRERKASGSLKSATYYDYAADQEAAASWKGVAAPPLIAEMLPQGVSLIDHPLLGATEPGVVKDGGSGEFLSLRLERDGMGTNLGVSRSALVQNLGRSKKSFVRDQAKAVIVFMHGGGTRTTGHHVAINLMNHFAPLGVDVVSFDQPWHGEGPRKTFESPREYFEWVRKWVRETVGVSGKPIFLAGHSMGGEFADTYMRLYPKDDLIKAVIALSPVVDPSPGLSMREKVMRQEARDEAARSETSETPEDRLLLQSLVTQNKLSFTALLFESLFSIQNSWVLPPHKGHDYIPALYVWGAKDWLYVGNEAVVESHIKSLPNAKVQIYGKRYDVVEKRDVDVGHIIFDHYRPGTDDLEAFADVRDFIEGITGSKLESEKTRSQNDDLLKKLVQAYVNNLAFRRFADHHVVYRKVANAEKIKGINSRMQELSGRSDPEAKAEYQRLNELRQGFYVPSGASGELGRQWKSELAQIKDEKFKLKGERERVRKDLENLRAKVKANDEALAEKLKGVTSEKLMALERETTRVLNSMFELNERIERAINQFYLERLSATKADFEPTAEIQALIRQYEALAEAYQQGGKKRERVLFEAALAGDLGLEVRALYIERFGESHASIEKPGAGSLLWKEAHLKIELDEVENKLLEFDDAEMRILVSLTEHYSDGLYRYEGVKLSTILNQSSTELTHYRAFMQDAWSRWQALWKERPPVVKASLY